VSRHVRYILLITIQPPSPEDSRGDIKSYRLRYRELGNNGDWKTCNILTSTNQPTTHTIQDLQPDTPYIIQVAAKNSSGYGPFSPEIECTTRQGKVTMYKCKWQTVIDESWYITAPRRPSVAPKFTILSTTDTIRVEIEVR